MMPILRFLYSRPGRITRIVVGVIMVFAGAALSGWWWLLALAGVVPVLTGLFDICTLGPLVGRPLSGRRFREIDQQQRPTPPRRQ